MRSRDAAACLFACFVAIAWVAAGAVAGPWHSAAGPTKPRIVGPRRTTDRTPTFRFVSHEAGLRSEAIRIRCAVDRKRLHRCQSRYTPRLSVGSHTLRARASDPEGRVSPTGTAHVSVVRPLPHADQTIRVGRDPYNVAEGFGSVWITVSGGLVRLDPTGGSVWAADNGSDKVWRRDPSTGQILGMTHVGDSHEFVGFGEGRVWVSSENGTVGRLDPVSGNVDGLIQAGADADFLGFSPGAIWVTNYRTDLLYRLDPAGAVTAKYSIGGGAQGVAFDGASLWVAMYNRGEVVRVDPNTGKVQRRVRIGVKPRGLAVAAGSVWVANSRSGTVSRIRVL